MSDRAVTSLNVRRYFTRAGRDALAQVSLVERELPGGTIMAPSEWSADACLKALDGTEVRGENDLLDLLRLMAKDIAEDAEKTELLSGQENLAAYEAEWLFVLARGLALPAVAEEDVAEAPNPTQPEAILDRLQAAAKVAKQAEDDHRKGAVRRIAKEATEAGISTDRVAEALRRAISGEGEADALVAIGEAFPPALGVVINPAALAEPITGRFDASAYRQVIELAAICAMSGAKEGGDSRFSLSLTNTAGTLMALGVPYDSPRGLTIGASLWALLAGDAHRVAAQIPGEDRKREDAESIAQRLERGRDDLDALPDISDPDPISVDPNRWKDQAGESLSSAVSELRQAGLALIPSIDCGVFPSAEGRLGVASRSLEPVRSLFSDEEGTELRPEARSGIRRLSETAEEGQDAISAVAQGGSIGEGLTERGLGSVLRTAPRAGSTHHVHPNAQIQFASAIQPFITGERRFGVLYAEQAADGESAPELEAGPTIVMEQEGSEVFEGHRREGWTYETESEAGRMLVHVMESENGETEEIAIDAYELQAEERALIDAFCQAASSALRRGASLEELTEEIRLGGGTDASQALLDGLALIRAASVEE